ncbi:hypothetical protein [Methylomicrobium sp. Wu6]|uniref:hypothetical protein n=1 Tax=Methylomicrobium sp. Wu6 TaxID=3107928 RepID=UPI002DD62657|nr:hypothetical protein [Methylomicrobium sp. Wu6]MEC4749319.1 hypothetical protein [Methylomicrobium sp. Wu6]
MSVVLSFYRIKIGQHMHLGRFHRAVELLHQDYKNLNPVQLIQEVQTSLNNIAGNPGNAEIASAYKAALDKCKNTLATSPLNTPRPILKDILDSIGAQKFIGNALFQQVRSAISSNPAAPSLAVQELSTIQQETQKFFQSIANIDNGFAELKVEYDALDAGEAEIGLLIPRVNNASTLKDLSKEFNQWHNVLAPIVELFDPNAPSLQIKTCATTDWMVYLASTPPVLWGFSKCVKGVNGILRELIETRDLIEKLIEKKRSPQAIEALKQEQAEGAKTELRTLAEQTVDEHYKGADKGRKNELKNAMTQSLTTLAQKITDGAKLEVSMLPPHPTKNDDEDATQNENETDYLADMQALAKSLDDEVEALCFNGEANVIRALLGHPEEIVLGQPEEAAEVA